VRSALDKALREGRIDAETVKYAKEKLLRDQVDFDIGVGGWNVDVPDNIKKRYSRPGSPLVITKLGNPQAIKRIPRSFPRSRAPSNNQTEEIAKEIGSQIERNRSARGSTKQAQGAIESYDDFRTAVRSGAIRVTPAMKAGREVPGLTGAALGLISAAIYLEQGRPFRAMLAYGGILYEPFDWIDASLPDDPTSLRQWRQSMTLDFGPPPPLRN